MVKHAVKKAFCVIKPKLAKWPGAGSCGSKLEVYNNFNIVVEVFEIRDNAMFHPNDR